MYRMWEQLPEGARKEIEATHTLWNQLVETFERRQARYREIIVQSSQAPEDSARIRSALAQLQQTFLTDARRLMSSCPATWANKEFVLNQFLATVSRFFKKQGRAPKPKHGAPQDVHFHHRFAGGGFSVQGLFGCSKRLRLEPVSAEAFDPALSQRQRKRLARTSGVFQVGDTTLPLQLLLHRPLPEDGILKAAALIGRQMVRAGFCHDANGGHVTAARWVWSLHLTMEIPPRAISARTGHSSPAVLDISQQLGGEGRLRVGVLSDPAGREEPLFLPEEILRAWQYKRQLQQRADQRLDETRSLLQGLEIGEGAPPAVRTLLARMQILREKGLWRLLQVLEKTNTDEAALGLVRRWADHAARLTREVRGLERRYLGHRDWFYRNMAAQLCQRYQQIIVKLPPRLEARAEREEVQAPQEATRYRHLAAPSTLCAFLLQAAAKTGAEIKAEPARLLSEPHAPAVSPAA
jgi:hypothetical protein